MSTHDLSVVLAGLDVAQRPGRYRVETVPRGSPPLRDAHVQAVVEEDEGTTVVVRDDGGPWAWLTLSVETDLELVGLVATIAPELARRGIPTNVLAGLRHDHLLVPHRLATEAIAGIRAIRDRHIGHGRQHAGRVGSSNESVRRELPVAELVRAAAVLTRITNPLLGPTLTALHHAGSGGCTDRELLTAVDGDPKAVLGLCAALVDAGIVEVVDGHNRITAERPPALATTLRDLARGPLEVPRELSGYVDNGRIARFPRNPDDLDALLACVVEVVGPGTVHTESSLSRRLATMGDPADLRRKLVDRGFAERTATGSRYFVRPVS